MKEDFIAYDNLRVSPYNFKHITEVKIENDVNEHAKLKLTGILEEDDADKYVYDTDEQTIISVYYEKENSSFALFYGIVTNVKVSADNYVYIIDIEAKSLTYHMDIAKKKRDFQNTSMTSHDVINEVMKAYPTAVYEINIPNEPIGQYILQYNETDYEFLKRIVSKYHGAVISAMELNNIHIYFGIPDNPIQPKSKINDFAVSKNVEEYNFVRQNDDTGIDESNFITYKIIADELFNVGENFEINGQKLYVKKANLNMNKASMKNVFLLTPKGGLRQNKLYNKNLIGISITGSIAEVQRDRVKVNLEIESVSGAEYWFPYSTVAASPDGGGWYCMPEIGERIRMNCPTKDESECYVVNAIGSHDGKGGEDDRMSNPDNKSLQASGQEVNFTPSGVNISSGGQASMNLNNDGTITVVGQSSINIACAQNLSIRAEKEINISAEKSVDILCESGSSLLLSEGDEIEVKGKRVQNNG